MYDYGYTMFCLRVNLTTYSYLSILLTSMILLYSSFSLQIPFTLLKKEGQRRRKERQKSLSLSSLVSSLSKATTRANYPLKLNISIIHKITRAIHLNLREWAIIFCLLITLQYCNVKCRTPRPGCPRDEIACM